MSKNPFSHILLLLLLCALPASATVAEKERLFYIYDASNGLASNSADHVVCTKTGRIMITTHGHVNFFDGYSFSHIDPHESDAIPLPGSKYEQSIYFDRYHHLWLKNRGLLTCVNLTTERFIRNVDQTIRELGVDSSVDNIYGDSGNNIWFLSGRTLYRAMSDKQIPLRSSAVVQHVDVYNDSLTLLFHTDGSVDVHDYRSGRFLFQDIPSDRGVWQHCLYSPAMLQHEGQFYVLRHDGSSSVLMRYDVVHRRWETLLEWPLVVNTMCAKDRQLYIGLQRGYTVYNIDSGEANHIETVRLTKGRTRIPDVQGLTFDRQGGMWIGTQSRGLLYDKPYEAPFRVLDTNSPEGESYVRLLDANQERQRNKAAVTPNASVHAANVNCVLRDSRGWIWTGSYTGLRLEKPNGVKRRFTRRQGLVNEVVHSIVEDSQHHIWAASSYGIYHLYVRGDEVYHLEPYINQDNVPNESFLNGRGMLLDDGTIVMQSIDHIVTFNPALFHAEQFDKMILYPKLIQLSVNGNVVEPDSTIGSRVVLDRSVTRAREVTVDYNQNSLLLVFSGLNYLRPTQTYYHVRVKGVAGYNDWVTLSYAKSHGMVDKNGMLRLPLVGLSPGTYVVEMQTSMWPSSWPQEPLTWTIHVEEPWWRTKGLYLTLALLFLLLLVANFYVYNRITQMRLMRSNDEADLLRRIKVFTDRCYDQSAGKLNPLTLQDGYAEGDYIKGRGFIDAMLAIVPYVHKNNGRQLTVDELARVAGVDTIQLYGLLPSYIDKPPHFLPFYLQLGEAAELLRQTDMTIEKIAEKCYFDSPNAFVAAFYHRYRMTPSDYRSRLC